MSKRRRDPRESLTTYFGRFTSAIALLCGGHQPPRDLVIDWLNHEETPGESLQDWVCEHVELEWAQGIVTLEAAELLADQPEEEPEPGLNHYGRLDRYE